MSVHCIDGAVCIDGTTHAAGVAVIVKEEQQHQSVGSSRDLKMEAASKRHMILSLHFFQNGAKIGF